MSNSKSIEPTELAKLVAATGATVILRDVIIGDMQFPEIEIRPAEPEINIHMDSISFTPAEFECKCSAPDCGVSFAGEKNFSGSLEVEFDAAQLDEFIRDGFADYAAEKLEPQDLIGDWITSAHERRIISGSTRNFGFDGEQMVEASGSGLEIQISTLHRSPEEVVDILERTFGTPAAPEPAIHLTADHTQIMRKCVGLSVGSATFVKNCYQANKSTPTWVRLMELRELGLMEREDAATGDLEFFFVTPEGMEFLGFPHSKVEA